MYFFSKLVAFFISPLGFSMSLAALAGWFAVRGGPRKAWMSGGLALLWLFFWSTPWASQALRSRLEARSPAVAVSEVPVSDAIVVLGGGVSPITREQPYPDMRSAADRVWHAARLYYAGKAPLVLASGGASSAYTASEAAAMARLLQDLGVPRTAIWLEPHSRTTASNALWVARWAATLPRPPRLLLVTSALHMPRAVLEFKAAGLDVVPAPTDYEARALPTGLLRFLPDTDALDGSARAMKELVGWAVAKL